jgi:ribosomal-protein-alanine N-acetyltransferase
VIRESNPADMEMLAAMHAACFSEPWSADAFGRLLQTPGTFARIAEHDGAACGFILARAVANEAEILSIGVLPLARRRRVGEGLVRAAAEQAASMAAGIIFLEVGADNQAARNLYRLLGFRQIGVRRAYYGQPDGTLEDALALSADIPLAGSRLGKPSIVD